MKRRRRIPGQLGLFGGSDDDAPPPPADAFAPGSFVGGAAMQRAAVLAYIAGRGAGGATCDEVEIGLGMAHQSASARINELVKDGAVVDSGMRRDTRYRRAARVLVVAPPAEGGECGST